ncbi:nucleoside phosphorylase domain-containing protein [Aspergillus alliaceus]|uniref:Nucleoside phosphorylase domain-containing protein n=1 Tax=Petromyces alliaceus TaxID=209559 RepID=A0A5N7CCD9_PETAA|nr:nucleoside phosphorylase domain-containing protein [Aspergillus alliaceus]
MPVVKSLPPSAYTVGWICALPLELTSAMAMLDEVHQSLPQRLGDNNTYTLGAIRGHNTVIACLPLGRYGNTSATKVASSMHSTFPAIRFSLLVGIGGGVPGKDADIRLGDVVVSMPSRTHPGVIQYDHGKTEAEGHFQRTGVLNKPPPGLLTATAKLQSKYAAGQDQVRELLAEAVERNPRTSLFTYPGEQYDLLFQAQYEHISKDKTCIDCDHSQLVERKPRMGQEPKVHYGLIASGNQVMKHGLTRDSVAQDLGALCFEMEAAGIMDDFPCLVIRGISDYADSHKLEQWQGYAAATAAAYTKELLSKVLYNHA